MFVAKKAGEKSPAFVYKPVGIFLILCLPSKSFCRKLKQVVFLVEERLICAIPIV